MLWYAPATTCDGVQILHPETQLPMTKAELARSRHVRGGGLPRGITVDDAHSLDHDAFALKLKPFASSIFTS